MIDDRDYMREPEYDEPRWARRWGVRWSLTLAFIIAYVVVFLADQFLQGIAPAEGRMLYGYLALSNEGLAHGYVWQLITYQFMHAGWLHLFFNCWAIYAFGLELELLLGRKRFAAVMLSSGMVGGVLQSLLTWGLPRFFPDASVVGASACAFGLVATFATLFPRRDLNLLIFFIIPVTVQARVLLYVFAAMAVLGIGLGFFTNMGTIAHAAHLGGMAMGWFYAKYVVKSPALIGTEEEPETPRRAPAVRKPEEKTPEEFLESEVDPILDKISARGIQSLTARERAILEAARKKISRP